MPVPANPSRPAAVNPGQHTNSAPLPPAADTGSPHQSGHAPLIPITAPSAGVVPAKSPGVAVLLSLLWLGAGHLYAGSVGVGVALVVFDMLLFLLSLTLVGLFLTIPVWLIATPITMILAANVATEFNRRNGIIVR